VDTVRDPMKAHSRPALLATFAAALVLSAWAAPLLAASTRGHVGGPPTRPLEPPLGPKQTPALVIGRDRQPNGHMEIVSYGAKGTARNERELCTWVEYVPGETIFGSCGAVSELSKERAVSIELFGQTIAPKAKRSTEIGGLLAPNVASVELRFQRSGRQNHVKATVAQVRGTLQQRLKQPAPFGYFVGQIKGLVPAAAITVRAYDANGSLLGSAGGGLA
jgi:hypothetical protein